MRDDNGIIFNDLYIFSKRLTLPTLEIYRFEVDDFFAYL
jgi:hypothetical protein